MCDHCGCSNSVTQPAHDHEHEHDHGDHDHAAPGMLQVRQSLLSLNERLAERNRGMFEALGISVFNLMSSPGSGKTTLLERTVSELGRRHRIGVLVGDLATENDARRIREKGARAVQITTGTACHLDAHMIHHAVEDLGLRDLNLLFIENVGNLVCPASFDLGESARVVLLSVTEGEDKPLKYPPIFLDADAVVVTKIDLADAAGFERDRLLENLAKVAPRAAVLEVSARTGAGLDRWYAWLTECMASHTT